MTIINNIVVTILPVFLWVLNMVSHTEGRT
jgi:hypothetical protein